MSDNSSRTSVRSDSESEGESRGRGRRDPEAVEGEPSLYVNPTIARDETQGESSRREQLLTTFNNRITSGRLTQGLKNGLHDPPSLTMMQDRH